MPIASEDLRRRVDLLLEQAGTPAVVKKLGVSREAIARLVAGLPVRAGTIALAEKGLKR